MWLCLLEVFSNTRGFIFQQIMSFRLQMLDTKLIKYFSLFNQPFDIMETLPYSFIHPIYPYDSLFFCKNKMHILINEIICEAIMLTFLNFIPINFNTFSLISAL